MRVSESGNIACNHEVALECSNLLCSELSEVTVDSNAEHLEIAYSVPLSSLFKSQFAVIHSADRLKSNIVHALSLA